MSDYFGVSPEGYQKPLYLANNLSDVVDKAAARSNLGVASADDVLKAANPIGTIISFYGAVAPYGYLPCSGQTISSTTFPSLVTFLGGTTSATLPDLRGEFLRGWDNGRGVDVSRSIRTLQLDQFQGHYHSLAPGNNQFIGTGTTGVGSQLTQVGSGNQGYAQVGPPATDGANGTPRVGSETRPRNVSILYCIKAYDTPVSATALNLTSLINEFQFGRSVTGFSNLKSSATGLSALVAITADEATLKTAATQYRTFTNISVSINTAGVGLNGLDTGTLAASTWYSTWVISDGTNVASLLSLSTVSPTMPSGYTYKARTGWILTDSVNKFPTSYVQFMRKFSYKVVVSGNLQRLPILSTGVQGSLTTPTWVEIPVASVVPPTAMSVDIVLSCPVNGTCMAAPNNSYGAYSSTTNPPPIVVAAPSTTTLNLGTNIVLESRNVYYASNNGTLAMLTLGWEDNF